MTDRKIDINGIVTYWQLADTSISSLKARLEQIEPGLEKFVPESTTPLAALRRALAQTFPKKLIRPLERDGFAVVLERRGSEENDYTGHGSAKIAPGGATIDFTNIESFYHSDIIGRAQANRDTLTPTVVGRVLSEIIVRRFGGTILRDAGGVYWVPEDQGDVYARVAQAFEVAKIGTTKPSAVYVLRTPLDTDTVRAVRDAIVNELAGRASAIDAEITGGELGERALKSRQQEAAALIAKAKRYEEALQADLAAIIETVGKVKDAAASAAILASIQGEKEAQASAAAA